MTATVDVEGLYAALDQAREGQGLSWRQLAKTLGLSPSTMSRLQNGHKPDLTAFAAMVKWLNADANKFLLSKDDQKTRAQQPKPDLVSEMAPLLRARGDLKKNDIELLEDLIRSAVRRIDSEKNPTED